jgi:DNA polymerase III delta subunit
MIYFLYGTDTYKSRKKLHELLSQAEKKRPDAEIFKLTSENWSEAQFDELLISQGLFEAKYTVVLDNLFEKKDIKEYVIDKIKELGESDQIFLMLDGKVDAATIKKIEKVAKQVQEFKLPESKKEGPSIFSVTDGLIQKDKKRLWISYIDFINNGVAPEEIHGIFFWQVKNMILASRTKNIGESGLSPFSFRSASTGAQKYNLEELKTMSSDLVEMTHKVREGKGDLDIMLEKWILEFN